MPELPEVETARRVLEPQLRGRRVERVELRRPELVAHPDADCFCARLTGQVFSGVGRRGKFLIFHLEGGERLIVHLRMTGCLLVAPMEHPMEKHTHLIAALEGGLELRFSDERRFGRLWLLGAEERDNFSGVEELGKEPFDPGFSAEYLSCRLGGRRRAIKACLMEQGAIAGIGNIYADEILFAARIHPSRSVSSLTAQEWARLAEEIPQRLAFFIEKSEISPEDYLAARGRDYRNAPFLQVYGREGERCPRCGSMLQRTKIGGRGSVYCPACQPMA